MIKVLVDKRFLVALTVVAIATAISIWQTYNYVWASRTLNATVDWSLKCISNEKDVICGALRSTKRNVDSYVEQMIWPVSYFFKSSSQYQLLNNGLWSKVEPQLAYSDAFRQQLRSELAAVKVAMNSMEAARKRSAEEKEVELENFKAEYAQLGAPKLLYSCDETLAMVAGRGGLSNFNSIYLEAKAECTGEFIVVDSEK